MWTPNLRGRQHHILYPTSWIITACSSPQAMKFLNSAGISVIGHIHSGNILLEESEEGQILSCRLAGYDMLLLGYRTRLYQKIRDARCLHRIDVIMFGEVSLIKVGRIAR